MKNPHYQNVEFDVIVIGAGTAGIYLLHRLREVGFTVLAVEAASDVGGTWYWNRYPGARCDVDSIFYSYQFDEDLQQEWVWTERYASQPEILDYLSFVADRFNLRPHIQFNTRVQSVHYNEARKFWRVESEGGKCVTATYCIMATGCLSIANTPNFLGLRDFDGPVYHTARWPHEPVNFSGLRVGLIGTGSSAVQIIPEVAREAAHLTVFQRTANYVVPARNRPLECEELRKIKADYSSLREDAKNTFGGFNFYPNENSAIETTIEEVDREYEKRWQAGGLSFMGAFSDLTYDANANKTAQDFVRGKIRGIVEDPKVAELLSPQGVFGCKRLCLDSGYFETFNRPNVKLVNVGATPIESITRQGIRVNGHEYEFDMLVIATGFDAMTGALLRMDIKGRDKITLRDKWDEGPKTYLGLATAGFPNLFLVTGPGSPSVLSNMVPSIEQHVEWISDCLEYLRNQKMTEIEADKSAENAWVDHVDEVAGKTLRYQCNSWYLGANISGKPRVFMPYIGGMPSYVEKCNTVAANGYEGFKITG